jgi:hypothetical protein
MTNQESINNVVAHGLATDDYVMGFWYDWFCRETSLHNKGISLLKKLKSVVNANRRSSTLGGKFNEVHTYTFFKNNCPMRGPLYDDFRICDITTGDVIFTITPKSGHNGKAEIWGKPNNFEGPLVSGTWKDVLTYFKA